MEELTLHFEAGAGTDLAAAAAALQASVAATAGIESATTRPQKFQAIDVAEIVSVIQVATVVAHNSAALLSALGTLYTAWEILKAKFPGLHAPKLEVGLKQIPIDQLTPEHLADMDWA